MSAAEPRVDAPPAALDETPYSSTARLLRLALPLIASHISVLAMQLVDTAFLSRYSFDLMGGAMFGGMVSWLVNGFFGGTAGYVGTFVAQYHGEGRPRRIGRAVWQGIYLSLAFGVATAAAAFAAEPLFARIGSDAEAVRRASVDYYYWLCLPGALVPLSMCLTGFYAGRGNNRPILAAQVAGTLVNIVLDYGLIFGRLGFAERGAAGAAIATALGQAAIVGLLALGLFRRKYRERFGAWTERGFDGDLLRRILRYGLPQGFRTVVEVALWIVFLHFISHVEAPPADGPIALAASSVAFRASSLAFMPVVGFSIAISMLVGQAQGARRPDLSWRALRRGLAVAEAWMALAVAVFLFAPQWILGPIMGGEVHIGNRPATPEEARAVMDVTRMLMRFVAAYCLFDGVNIVLCSVLQGAGDTLWTMAASVIAHLAAIAAFWLVGESLYGQWTAATAFLALMAGLWAWRLAGRRWERMKVTESAEARLVSAESQRMSARYVPE